MRKYFETLLVPKIKRKSPNPCEKNCLKCVAFSPQSGKSEGFLQTPEKGNMPFEAVHINHCGPLAAGPRAKKYFSVVVDAYTKFIKLFAVKSTTTAETVKCLEEYFVNYSKPRTIISDRGTCVTSKEFKDFVDGLQIRHILVATASPQGNGQVERINRIVVPMIAKLTDQKKWYQVLNDAEFALNNSVNKSTGETPSKLLFGINQNRKISDNIQEYLDQASAPEKNLETLREKANREIKNSQQYNKRYYDKKRKPPFKYKVGDLVTLTYSRPVAHRVCNDNEEQLLILSEVVVKIRFVLN